MVWVCPNCGLENETGDAFCPTCNFERPDWVMMIHRAEGQDDGDGGGETKGGCADFRDSRDGGTTAVGAGAPRSAMTDNPTHVVKHRERVPCRHWRGRM